MITEKEYLEAVELITRYKQQISDEVDSIVGNSMTIGEYIMKHPGSKVSNCLDHFNVGYRDVNLFAERSRFFKVIEKSNSNCKWIEFDYNMPLSELSKITDKEFLKQRNLGKVTLQEIRMIQNIKRDE